jgi:RNA polymerase sigma-70 factor, ECF subfamily
MDEADAVSPGLVAAAMAEQARELDDFDAVVRAHWARVYRFALASLRDRDAAGTVAQDCFLRAHRSRAQFRGEASVQTWLMQITVNLLRDHSRSARWQFWRRGRVAGLADAKELMEGAAGAERSLIAREQADAIWRATAVLPERQRTVFFLRFVEEMELLEIATVTGLKEGAVKNHLFRAVRRVRREVRGV